MTLDGISGDFAGHSDEERTQDEHPAVVLADLAGRPRAHAHVIAFANEKGGVGKSTLAFHCAVALAQAGARVLAIDCDRRQQTLGRLFEARAGTARTLKAALPMPRQAVLDRQSGALLLQEIERLGRDCDYVLIDLAGHDSPTARRAIALADTLVTPVNCSPTDLDALGWINPVTRRFRQAGPFSAVVSALRQERIARGEPTFDWVVARNRVRHCEHRLIASVEENLATMAGHLGFRTVSGLTERVSYRDLLPFGLTQLDLKLIPGLAAPRSSSLRELRLLVESLRLPGIGTVARPPRAPVSEAPVLARTAESYRQALCRSAPPRIAANA